MAYRSSKRPSWRQLKPSQVLPVWTAANSNASNIVVQEVFAHLGITDFRTYYRQLRVVIVICAIAGAFVGAVSYQLKGLLVGALLGFATPAFAIWFGTVLVLICIFLAVYCAAWAVILWLAWWILGEMFGG
jgi:hypothetical protein